MNLRFTIGLCAVVIGVFSVSLCQPPTPRIAKGEEPADVVVAPGGTSAQGALVAFDSTEQAIQAGDLDGLLINSSKHYHESELRH